MMNDIQKLSTFLLFEIHKVIDKSNGFMAFDLVKLAKKYHTRRGIIKEAFLSLENQEQVDLFFVQDDKRKVGVIYREDPRREELLEYFEKLASSR